MRAARDDANFVAGGNSIHADGSPKGPKPHAAEAKFALAGAAI